LGNEEQVNLLKNKMKWVFSIFYFILNDVNDLGDCPIDINKMCNAAFKKSFNLGNSKWHLFS
jgi:hypothetical protein